MKKVLCLVLVICLFAGTYINVEAKAVSVRVNGENIYFMPHPVIENDRTMVPLNVFLYLNCDVKIHNYYKTVLIQKGDVKVLLKMDSVEYVVFSGSFEELEKKINEQSWSDTEKRTFTQAPHQIGFQGFVPLRELCEVFGYNVGWDNAKVEVVLTCDEANQQMMNNDTSFALSFIKFLNEKEAEEKALKAREGYEAGNFEVLKKYGIIDENTDKYISVVDAMKVIYNVADGEESSTWLDDWYTYDALAPLDDIVDEETKNLLMNLYFGDYILTIGDIARLDYTAYITEYDALLFVLRMVGNTYGCTDSPVEYSYRTKEEVYPRAVERKLIDCADDSNWDKPILREDFYELVNRAIFTSFESGGVAGVSTVRYADYLEGRKRAAENKKEPVVVTKELDSKVTWNDDMSLSWTVPEEIKTESYFTNMNGYTQSGTRVYAIGCSYRNEINYYSLVEMAVEAYPEQLDKIEIIYSKTDKEANTKTKYVLTIDATCVKTVCEGEAPEPGIYARNKRQWPASSLSLAEGYNFEKGAYYVIFSKDNSYRKDEYNYTDYDTFKANSNMNKISIFGKHAPVGVTHLTEIHIIKAIVTGNGADGFVVKMTAPSKGVFEIVEQ